MNPPLPSVTIVALIEAFAHHNAPSGSSDAAQVFGELAGYATRLEAERDELAARLKEHHDRAGIIDECPPCEAIIDENLRRRGLLTDPK